MLQKKNDNVAMNREWYCKKSQWVSNFGAHPVGGSKDSSAAEGGGQSSSSWSGGEGGGGSSSAAKSAGAQGGVGGSLSEEMVVPADEHFTRCPVSNEAFIPEWDDEEGDYMYRSAVKVLVSAASDGALFERCQPTTQGQLRYAIVHQLLVMDGWLASGKAVTVQEAVRRLQSGVAGGVGDEEGGGRAEQALQAALGEEDDAEDVFLVLDAEGKIGADLFQLCAVSSEAGEEDEDGAMQEDEDGDAKIELVSV